MMLSDVCLSVAYIMNIHGAHSYWKQGALGAAGVRCVRMGWSWAVACGVQGRGHIERPHAQLITINLQLHISSITGSTRHVFLRLLLYFGVIKYTQYFLSSIGLFGVMLICL